MRVQLQLEEFVAIQAALDGSQAREAVLAASGLSVDDWEAERERWLARLAAEARRGRFGLHHHYLQLLGAQRKQVLAQTRAALRQVDGPFPVAPTVHIAGIAALTSTSSTPAPEAMDRLRGMRTRG